MKKNNLLPGLLLGITLAAFTSAIIAVTGCKNETTSPDINDITAPSSTGTSSSSSSSSASTNTNASGLTTWGIFDDTYGYHIFRFYTNDIGGPISTLAEDYGDNGLSNSHWSLLAALPKWTSASDAHTLSIEVSLLNGTGYEMANGSVVSFWIKPDVSTALTITLQASAVPYDTFINTAFPVVNVLSNVWTLIAITNDNIGTTGTYLGRIVIENTGAENIMAAYIDDITVTLTKTNATYGTTPTQVDYPLPAGMSNYGIFSDVYGNNIWALEVGNAAAPNSTIVSNSLGQGYTNSPNVLSNYLPKYDSAGTSDWHFVYVHTTLNLSNSNIMLTNGSFISFFIKPDVAGFLSVRLETSTNWNSSFISRDYSIGNIDGGKYSRIVITNNAAEQNNFIRRIGFQNLGGVDWNEVLIDEMTLSIPQ